MVKRLSLPVLVASLLLLSGCGGGGSSTSNKPKVLFVNASADAGALDFRLDDGSFASNLAYATSNAQLSEIDYHGPDIDGWDVSLHKNSDGTEIERQAIVFGEGTDNLIIAHGQLNYAVGDQLKRLRFHTFPIDRSIPNGNKAKLIIFHAFELSSGLDTPPVVFKTPGDNALFSTGDIEPGSSAVLTTDSGTLTFEARRAGTSGIYTTKTQTLAAGGVYLVLISGIQNDPTPAKQIQIKFIQLPGEL